MSHRTFTLLTCDKCGATKEGGTGEEWATRIPIRIGKDNPHCYSMKNHPEVDLCLVCTRHALAFAVRGLSLKQGRILVRYLKPKPNVQPLT